MYAESRGAVYTYLCVYARRSVCGPGLSPARCGAQRARCWSPGGRAHGRCRLQPSGGVSTPLGPSRRLFFPRKAGNALADYASRTPAGGGPGVGQRGAGPGRAGERGPADGDACAFPSRSRARGAAAPTRAGRSRRRRPPPRSRGSPSRPATAAPSTCPSRSTPPRSTTPAPRCRRRG